MNHAEWSKLKYEMAIEAIAQDLCELYVPHKTGIEQAQAMFIKRHLQALEVEHKMGQALIALEVIGYDLIKKTS